MSPWLAAQSCSFAVYSYTAPLQLYDISVLRLGHPSTQVKFFCPHASPPTARHLVCFNFTTALHRPRSAGSVPSSESVLITMHMPVFPAGSSPSRTTASRIQHLVQSFVHISTISDRASHKLSISEGGASAQLSCTPTVHLGAATCASIARKVHSLFLQTPGRWSVDRCPPAARRVTVVDGRHRMTTMTQCNVFTTSSSNTVGQRREPRECVFARVPLGFDSCVEASAVHRQFPRAVFVDFHFTRRVLPHILDSILHYAISERACVYAHLIALYNCEIFSTCPYPHSYCPMACVCSIMLVKKPFFSDRVGRTLPRPARLFLLFHVHLTLIYDRRRPQKSTSWRTAASCLLACLSRTIGVPRSQQPPLVFPR